MIHSLEMEVAVIWGTVEDMRRGRKSEEPMRERRPTASKWQTVQRGLRQGKYG